MIVGLCMKSHEKESLSEAGRRGGREGTESESTARCPTCW